MIAEQNKQTAVNG